MYKFNSHYGSIRALIINSEPHFVSSDISSILGYTTNAKALKLISEDSKKTYSKSELLPYDKGPEPLPTYSTFINTTGLWTLLTLNVTPQANYLSSWIKSTVIPQLKSPTETPVQTPTIFTNSDFSVRVLTIDNEPWFVGKDVAEALGYERADNAIRTHVDDEDKLTHQISASGQNRNMTIINESGLYSLILSSKLESAKKFKHWVTSEVLPTIRKTGGYVHNDETFIETYLPFADEATKNLFRANLQVISQQNEKIRQQAQQLEEQKPHVEFSKHVHSSDTLITIAEMAQLLKNNGIDIGEVRLFDFLRKQKVLITKYPRHNYPYQKYLQSGYFKLVEKSRFDTEKQKYVLYGQTYITGKGQEFIYRLVKARYAA